MGLIGYGRIVAAAVLVACGTARAVEIPLTVEEPIGVARAGSGVGRHSFAGRQV